MSGETVEKKLYNAASNGDLTTLEQLLQEDPYLVHETPFAYSRNLLHVAAMHGQAAIVEKVLKMNPRLATSLDSKNSSSLHIATAEGSLEIVKKLLSVAPEVCWWRDCHDMNPIHIATINGHVHILEELLQESPLPAMERLHRGQTVFHLCVKHGQLTTLKVLVEKLGELVRAKDDDGETLLHLAARSNQLEIVKYLVEYKITATQTANSMGKTELKILNERESPRDASSSEIKNMLKKLPNQSEMLPARMGESILVALVLMATMAFQAGIAPPGGVWDENKNTTIAGGNNITFKAGESILASTDDALYKVFVYFNTAAFIVSLVTIMLIMTGLPSRNLRFFYIAMFLLFASGFSVSVSYAISIILITPGNGSYNIYLFLVIYFFGALFLTFIWLKVVRRLD